MAKFVEIKGAELMEKIEALCNKSVDTMPDIIYDNDLPVGILWYEVLLMGINN